MMANSCGNVAWKVTLHFFNLYHHYSISLTSSNTSKFWSSGAEFLSTISKFRKRKKSLSLLVYASSTKCRKRHFHMVVVQWWQRNVQKMWCMCKVVVLPCLAFVYLMFSLSLLLGCLKLCIIHDNLWSVTNRIFSVQGISRKWKFPLHTQPWGTMNQTSMVRQNLLCTNSWKELRRCCLPIGRYNAKHFWCPIRSQHLLYRLEMVRWESVPRTSPAHAWILLSSLLSQPDWLSLDLLGWIHWYLVNVLTFKCSQWWA